ncbi:MAG: ParB/RepB/Spo0J family partition protein [Planctomycetes bacterium]|nr:ParB/RepB/Spo0J family partition protein [Planctomycetota bacterium]
MATATMEKTARKVKRKRQPAKVKTTVQHSEVKIADVQFNPQNVRSTPTADDLETLAHSIRTDGLLAPIGVRRDAAGGLTVIYGERRLRAAQAAGWRSIPANVYECDDAAALLMMVEENLQRRNLNAIETAHALQLLLRNIDQGGAGLTQGKIGERFGKGQSWVANMIRLLKLPEDWQRRVISREISAFEARTLVPFAKRPEVLAAVDESRRTQPERWRTARDFESSLRRVVDLIDGLTAASAEHGEADYRRRAQQVDHAAGAAVAGDWSAESNPVQADSPAELNPRPADDRPVDTAVAVIVRAVELVDNEADLEALASNVQVTIERAVVARRLQLTAAKGTP